MPEGRIYTPVGAYPPDYWWWSVEESCDALMAYLDRVPVIQPEAMSLLFAAPPTRPQIKAMAKKGQIVLKRSKWQKLGLSDELIFNPQRVTKKGGFDERPPTYGFSGWNPLMCPMMLLAGLETEGGRLLLGDDFLNFARRFAPVEDLPLGWLWQNGGWGTGMVLNRTGANSEEWVFAIAAPSPQPNYTSWRRRVLSSLLNGIGGLICSRETVGKLKVSLRIIWGARSPHQTPYHKDGVKRWMEGVQELLRSDLFLHSHGPSEAYPLKSLRVVHNLIMGVAKSPRSWVVFRPGEIGEHLWERRPFREV